MIDIDSMDEEQLDKFFEKRGFEEDEIKATFPTLDKKREAAKQVVQLAKQSKTVDDKFGWDDEDDTKLKKDQKQTVEERTKERDELRKKIADNEAKQKTVAEEVEKEADKDLKESIAETKAPVTPTEVKSTMEDIKALMADEDDEDDED